ncbi:MAG: SDR family oxidoreductase [Chloroflexi bacterium]|nr:SDR family oxidoreductase [Chloroflexota bacterium]MCC6892730.1 SDR family oxidoreductase [Anaerolineae bacterium]
MTARILITGATGNVGSEVVRGLQALSIPFRIGLVNPSSTCLEANDHMEVVPFDFLNPETYSAAFAGIQHLFLMRPPALSNVWRDIAPAVRAAVECGVEHIVFLSLQGVEQNRITPHYKIEKLIEQLGVRYTFLRAGFFMQNLSTTQAAEIRDAGEIALPVGKAKTSFVDVRDIAAVAVYALTADQHESQKYTLTGPEALDYTQVALKLSHVLERSIRYTNPSVFRFIWRQLRAGRGLGYTLVVAGLYTITRLGNAKTVTDDVQRILGRPAIPFDQFAHDYRASWQ